MNSTKNTISISKKKFEIVFLVFIFLFFKNNLAQSATAEEIQKQIDNITATKLQLEKEIADYEQQLKDISAQSETLSNTIKSLNVTINKNALDIKLTQNNIDSTQLQIEELSKNIGKNVTIIDQNTRAVASLLNEINRYDDTSLVENLVAYDDMSDFWNEEKNIAIIEDKIRANIIETQNTKVALEKNKATAEKKKKDLIALKSSLVDQKNLLDITKKEKNKLLTDTKSSETIYKNMLADKKSLAEAFDNELEQFESQLKIVVDKSSIPTPRHGILSWPLSPIRITQLFGKTIDSVRLYASGTHNGMDFAASIGTPIKSSLSGVVKGTGDTDTVCPKASFGKWVLIEHGNGLSTIYAHLSLIKVYPGQVVNTGDIIGYSGNTGYTTGPHLHLTVYATQGVKIMDYKSKVCKGTYTMPVADIDSYLDPGAYLPAI